MNAPTDLAVAQQSSSTPLWRVVLVLTYCHAVAVASSQILNIAVEPIKGAFELSDSRFSLLQGLAFTTCFALVALPAARLADRGVRRRLLSVGVVVWTAATLLCGVAHSFEQLLLARVFVGVGEAVLLPVAVSLIGQLARQENLATAMTVFGSGSPLGIAMALYGGGWLLGNWQEPALGVGLAGWRAGFFACAALGLVAVALTLSLPEPAAERAVATRHSGSHAHARWIVLRHIADRPRAFCAVGGFVCLALGSAAVGAWSPAFLIRRYGISVAEAGRIVGTAAVVFAVLGALTGGVVTDMAKRKRRDDAPLLLAMVAGICAFIPAMLGMVGASTSGGAAIGLCATFYFLALALALAPVVTQQLSPPAARAQIFSLYLLITTLIGFGLGPSAVALISDRVLRGPQDVGVALVIVCVCAATTASALFAWAHSAYVREIATTAR